MCASTSSGAHRSIGGEGVVRLRAAAVVLEEQVLRHGRLRGVVGRACRGPSPGERRRPEVLDIEALSRAAYDAMLRDPAARPHLEGAAATANGFDPIVAAVVHSRGA